MLLLAGAAADELKWMTDLPKAQALAAKEKKLVLLNFTGSDWCGFCVKLDREVFSTEKFAKYAKEKLVLVEVDFPSRKKLPSELAKANQALKQKYSIRGFPTLLVLDGKGKEVGRKVGYGGDGTDALLATLEAARKS